MNLRERMFKSPRLFRRVMNLYPPFLGAGIRIVNVDEDFRGIDVELRPSRFTGNRQNTHFGGSIFAMTDPFFALIIAAHMGRDYVVWDKAAHIDFVRPGVGTVKARFALSAEQIEAVRVGTAEGRKYLPEYQCEVLDREDRVVARVVKTVYVRRRAAAGPKPL